MPISVMLLVLVAAALHAIWNGLVKAGTDRYIDIAGVLLGAGAIALIVLPFLPHPASASWPYLAVSSLIHLVYFALVAASYHKGEMSVVYPIMRGTAPALAAVGSAILLHETPSPTGWVGVSLVSAGVVAFAFDRRPAGIHFTPIAIALVNAVIIALYTLVDGEGVRLSGQALSYTCTGFLLCALGFIPAIAAIRKREIVVHLRSEWRRGLIGGCCSIAAYTLALWAMTRAPIASVAALRETAILFGVLIAAYSLKERVTAVRVIGCLLVVTGAIIIKLS